THRVLRRVIALHAETRQHQCQGYFGAFAGRDVESALAPKNKVSFSMPNQSGMLGKVSLSRHASVRTNCTTLRWTTNALPARRCPGSLVVADVLHSLGQECKRMTNMVVYLIGTILVV